MLQILSYATGPLIIISFATLLHEFVDMRVLSFVVRGERALFQYISFVE